MPAVRRSVPLALIASLLSPRSGASAGSPPGTRRAASHLLDVLLDPARLQIGVALSAQFEPTL
jgi:hypothetical protein